MEQQDLKMAAIAQVTIMDAQNLVDELERLRLAYSKQLGALSLTLKAFSDLYLELTDKTSRRKWLARQIERAEKAAAAQCLPSWFWRLDKDLPIDDQIYRRARFLRKEKPNIHLDDIWDSITDACRLSEIEVPDKLLSESIGRALDASTN